VPADQIVEAIAVQIGEGHSGRRQGERAGVEGRAGEAAELERRPIGFGESNAGNADPDLGRVEHAYLSETNGLFCFLATA
jgi:hypothetical protein